MYKKMIYFSFRSEVDQNVQNIIYSSFRPEQIRVCFCWFHRLLSRAQPFSHRLISMVCIRISFSFSSLPVFFKHEVMCTMKADSDCVLVARFIFFHSGILKKKRKNVLISFREVVFLFQFLSMTFLICQTFVRFVFCFFCLFCFAFCFFVFWKMCLVFVCCNAFAVL